MGNLIDDIKKKAGERNSELDSIYEMMNPKGEKDTEEIKKKKKKKSIFNIFEKEQ